MSMMPKPGDAFNPFMLFNGAWLPNGVLERTDLSPGSKLSYGRLLQYAGRDGVAFPSVATLGREIGVKERRARELIAELEAVKLIERRPVPGRTNRFVFLWQEWIGTPRQDSAGAAGSCRPPRQDSAGEETQGRDSPPEAAPLGGTPHDNGALFGMPDQEIDHGRKQTGRGSRLEADWQPPAEVWDFGRSLGLDEREVADELDRFRDYWIAKPGKDGRKLDWCATFRNWLRRTADDRRRGPGHAGGSRGRRDRRDPASVVDAVNRILD
jgi:hypothetical protein